MVPRPSAARQAQAAHRRALGEGIGLARAHRLTVLLLLVLLIVPMPRAAAGERELDVILDSTQHWVGTNDVLLSVYRTEVGASLADAGADLEVRLTGPDGSALVAQPAVERFATYGRRLYRARVSLGQVGTWAVEVRAEIDGSPHVGSTVLEVWPDMGTPPLGAVAPGGETPTMRDAHSLMHHISSDPEPLTAFYTWSLDDALAQSQPTVLVLDSYAFRPNAACGGALGILHEVFIDYPGLTIIHAEPWHMALGADGHTLGLDPPGGPAVLTDYAEAWGISEPPWVFIIDRDGRLHAKFTGVMGSDELRAAVTSVTPWRPVGGAG